MYDRERTTIATIVLFRVIVLIAICFDFWIFIMECSLLGLKNICEWMRVQFLMLVSKKAPVWWIQVPIRGTWQSVQALVKEYKADFVWSGWDGLSSAEGVLYSLPKACSGIIGTCNSGSGCIYHWLDFKSFLLFFLSRSFKDLYRYKKGDPFYILNLLLPTFAWDLLEEEKMKKATARSAVSCLEPQKDQAIHRLERFSSLELFLEERGKGFRTEKEITDWVVARVSSCRTMMRENILLESREMQ